MPRIDRKLAARLGNQTVAILDAGGYEGPDGWVDLRASVQVAAEGTQSYPPDAEVPGPSVGAGRSTVVEVRNETTLVAARRLAEAGSEPVALNFASAYHPGGGFRGGSRAQEESLARSSGLYACIADHPMYEYNRAHRSPLYTDWLLYSPSVPVFRTDDGALLAQPYGCAFITAPAPNAKVLLQRDPSARAQIQPVMRRRIDRVLAAAATHGHRAVVLGAWGCGAFGNDPKDIAPLFGEALDPERGRFADCFDRIVFAVVDWTDELRILGPFRRAVERGVGETNGHD